ncbi:MAG: hypothetical protein NWE89_11550 [Candidatus Bathyarchaeota archaeon]|nr:hypothetical protein [Candidatus Bathyarchaeota archaeon]
MNKRIMKKLIMWLRRKHPGTVVRLRDFWMEYLKFLFGFVPMQATLGIRVFRTDGTIEDLGIVSAHSVTDAFVAELVDTLQSAVAGFSTYKYHDSGTGTNAEAAGDTALQTPCGEARTVGSQAEGATANIYKTVATHTYAGAFSITEHILFNAAAAGTGMDRSVFAAVGVGIGDRIEWTYELTCVSGG